jgi:translation initiation factor IF-1
MSREELLAARIRQLERRPEDVERATEKLRTARIRNKERFDRTHRLRPKKIEEGDWVLVYDSSLDNQHKAARKFARRWFGPYVVTSVDDNGTYHLAELDGTRITVLVAGKRVMAFKKRDNDELDLETGGDDDKSDNDMDGTDGEIIIEI